jgi:hypothetical protein
MSEQLYFNIYPNYSLPNEERRAIISIKQFKGFDHSFGIELIVSQLIINDNMGGKNCVYFYEKEQVEDMMS